MPTYPFTTSSGFPSAFDQSNMDFTVEPTTEDYDYSWLYFSIIIFYMILMLIFLLIIYCYRRHERDVEGGMCDPENDGWLVHVAHNESLPRYEDETYDAPPSYDDAMNYSVRVIVMDSSSVDGNMVFFGARSAATA